VKYRLLSTLLLNELQKENSVKQEQELELAELKAEVAELRQLMVQIAGGNGLDLEALVTNMAAD
jgi:hypothetical protein